MAKPELLRTGLRLPTRTLGTSGAVKAKRKKSHTNEAKNDVRLVPKADVVSCSGNGRTGR